MSIRVTICLGITLSLFLSLAPMHSCAQDTEPDPTKWTSAQGKTIDAEFVRLDDDGVVLKLKSNGQQATVPFASLNLESHLKAIKLGKPEEFSKPIVKAEIAPVIEPPALNVIDIEAALRTPFNSSQSLEQFVSTLGSEIDQGNLFAVWHALPEKMQGDFTTLISKLLTQLGPEKMTQVRELVKNVHTIFRDKKDFVFANPLLMEEKQTRKDLYSQWAILEQSIGSFNDENLWKKENVQEENLERFLAHLFSVVGANIAVGAELASEQGMPMPPASSLIRVVSAKDDVGKISVALPIPMLPPQEVTARKVRGTWVVPAWMNFLREGLDKGLAEVDSLDSSAASAAATTGLATANSIVGALAYAKTQEEFDLAVEQLRPYIEQAKSAAASQSAMMAGMGGPPPGMGGGMGRGQAGPGGNRAGGLGAGAGSSTQGGTRRRGSLGGVGM